MWQGTHFLPVLSTYTANYSYNDCVQDEMLDAIEGEIGCQPPLLDKAPRLSISIVIIWILLSDTHYLPAQPIQYK